MLDVVDNLNCVQVINKPYVREARCMRLIPWTLQSGSEQDEMVHEYISFSSALSAPFSSGLCEETVL
jgi:hypothetical protein